MTDKEKSIKILHTFTLLSKVMEEETDLVYDKDGMIKGVIIRKNLTACLKKVAPLFIQLEELGAPIPKETIAKMKQITAD